MTSKKQALDEAQEILDDAASKGELKEHVYIQLSNSLMKVNTGIEERTRDIKLDLFAEMARSNPYSAKVASRDIFPLDPEVVQMVLEKGQDEEDHWWHWIMEVYHDFITDDIEDMHVADRMSCIADFVELLDFRGQKHFSNVCLENRTCFVCMFQDEVRRPVLKEFVTDVLANAPQIIVNVASCSHAHRVSWGRMKWCARDCACADHWEDSGFVRAVGNRKRKRGNACPVSPSETYRMDDP